MAKTVTITNGSGTVDLINGSYNITASVPGYDDSSLNPSSIVVSADTNTYAFTISADGTLTIHVTEDGTSSGTPVVGATFVRTDSEGNEYGTEITSDSSGNAVFNNVPYAASNAPIIYFKQLSSDGEHEFSNLVQSVTLTTSTFTEVIENTKAATRTITLNDTNYGNLPLSGTIIIG